MIDFPRYLPAGDQGLVVEFGNTIDPEINRRVRDLCLALDAADVPGGSASFEGPQVLTAPGARASLQTSGFLSGCSEQKPLRVKSSAA